MPGVVQFDRDALATACVAHGVRRLRLFGSALTDAFDAERSDVDLLVDFLPGLEDVFEAYFGLRDDLERVFDRGVDLVMADAVTNRFFVAAVFGSAEDVYAA